MMDVQAKRVELAKWILSLNEDLLSKVDSIKSSSSSEIVAYTVKGEALTKQDYIEKVKEAEARIDSGIFTTHEDLGKEMQNW